MYTKILKIHNFLHKFFIQVLRMFSLFAQNHWDPVISMFFFLQTIQYIFFFSKTSFANRTFILYIHLYEFWIITHKSWLDVSCLFFLRRWLNWIWYWNSFVGQYLYCLKEIVVQCGSLELTVSNWQQAAGSGRQRGCCRKRWPKVAVEDRRGRDATGGGVRWQRSWGNDDE